jgi:hypothetical protein
MAWTFAQLIAAKPQRNRAVVNRQDSWSAVWGNCCLYPPDEMTWIVDAIAATESRDIAKNIRALDKVASTPGALVHQFL